MADHVEDNILSTSPPTSQGEAARSQTEGSLMTPRCLCCGRPLDDPAENRDGWHRTCAGAVLAGVMGLRDGPPDVVGARVAWLRDNEADVIADCVVGVVPFDGQGLRDHE